jgi:hypothetical protein
MKKNGSVEPREPRETTAEKQALLKKKLPANIKQKKK